MAKILTTDRGVRIRLNLPPDPRVYFSSEPFLPKNRVEFSVYGGFMQF